MDGEVGDKCGLNTTPGIFSDKENDQPGELVISQGEGISFLMGCSKNYIMYWGGVTLIIISHPQKEVDYECAQRFLGIGIFFMKNTQRR